MQEGVSVIGGTRSEMEKGSFSRLRRIAFWEEEGCLAHCTVGEVTSLPPGTYFSVGVLAQHDELCLLQVWARA